MNRQWKTFVSDESGISDLVLQILVLGVGVLIGVPLVLAIFGKLGAVVDRIKAVIDQILGM
jgi:hypothetical protein